MKVFSLFTGTMDEASRILDLEKVVSDWAWRQFDQTATKKEEKLRKKDKNARFGKKGIYINVQVDWSELQVTDSTEWDTITEYAEPDPQKHQQKVESVRGVPRVEGDPASSILFETKFTNTTNKEMEYTMKTEKVTKTTCTTEIESSYTRGIDVGITLKSPGEFVEANVGYHREYTLTDVKSDTFEHEMHWGVDSVIKVDQSSIVYASLTVDEREKRGGFIITSEMQGMVYVTFTDIRDNNSLLKATGYPISKIVDEWLQRQRKDGRNIDFVQVDNNKVFITTRGKCNFRYGVKQEVKVHQEKIKPK